MKTLIRKKLKKIAKVAIKYSSNKELILLLDSTNKCNYWKAHNIYLESMGKDRNWTAYIVAKCNIDEDLLSNYTVEECIERLKSIIFEYFFDKGGRTKIK